MNGWLPVPDFYFFAAGSSEGYTSLNAFDGCLMNAGIGNTNLIRLSSIIPPNCSEDQPVKLPYGHAVPVAYAFISSQTPGEIISAAVAAALPKDPTLPGLIMEYSARGHKEDIEGIVTNMAKEGMKMRGYEIDHITVKSVEHVVERVGGAFASVVLWNRAMVKG